MGVDEISKGKSREEREVYERPAAWKHLLLISRHCRQIEVLSGNRALKPACVSQGGTQKQAVLTKQGKDSNKRIYTICPLTHHDAGKCQR